MSQAILFLFGEGSHLNPLQMAMRATIVFMLALAMIRLSGRRSFGQHRAFDACTTVLLGAVLSRAVVGASPFWSTMGAGAVIVVLHRIVAMASLRWPKFESLVSGDKRELVRNGQRDPDEMRKALLTQRDLDEAVRKKAGDEAAPVQRAVLERDGEVTVRIASERGGDRVHTALHEMEHGTLRAGSGKKVTSRKQAVAIGLSESRRAGGKVPKSGH